jgi:hypothetical protein
MAIRTVWTEEETKTLPMYMKHYTKFGTAATFIIKIT